ncbi:hypothetical protein [Streptomyces sp. NPDC048106]|uniref:hypothetical protein n=1 Tax=Streptomyces sp. NPDC048106 TaxID=3155750 RepID=UPI00345592CA
MTEHGAASAIPQNLYDYSDQCTHAAEEVQTWVRTAFVPALQNYLRGAAARTGAVTVDTAAVSRAVDGMVADLAPQIAAVYYTDRNVRLTGRAFMEAGGSGPMGVPGGRQEQANRVIRTTDAAVADAPRQVALLALARLRSDPAGMFALLRQNSDDPAFCAAFMKALTPAQLTFFLSIGFTGQAADGTALNGVQYKLSAPDPDSPEMVANRKLLLNVVTSGMSGMSPTEIEQLMRTVVPYFERQGPEELHALLPDLTRFLMTGVTGSVTPIGTQAPDKWAPAMGDRVAREINPYLALLKAADIKVNDSDAFWKSVFQGAVINTLTTPLAFANPPSGVAAKLAVTAALNFVVGGLESAAAAKDPTNALGLGGLMKGYNGNRDVITLNAAIDAQAGWSALVASLVASGKVMDGNRKVLELHGGPDDMVLLTRIMKHTHDYYVTGPATGKVGQTVSSVALVIDGFNTGAHYVDPQSPFARLIYGE